MSEEIFPDWENEDMPEPQPILTLSWEDIFEKAREITQSEFDRDPTPKEIKEIFNTLSSKGMDAENGTFWSAVEYLCDEYYEEVTQ